MIARFSKITDAISKFTKITEDEKKKEKILNKIKKEKAKKSGKVFLILTIVFFLLYKIGGDRILLNITLAFFAVTIVQNLISLGKNKKINEKIKAMNDEISTLDVDGFRGNNSLILPKLKSINNLMPDNEFNVYVDSAFPCKVSSLTKTKKLKNGRTLYFYNSTPLYLIGEVQKEINLRIWSQIFNVSKTNSGYEKAKENLRINFKYSTLKFSYSPNIEDLTKRACDVLSKKNIKKISGKEGSIFIFIQGDFKKIHHINFFNSVIQFLSSIIIDIEKSAK